MTVSNESIGKITDKLLDEVAHEIMIGDEWINLVCDTARELVSKKIGEIDEALLNEISLIVYSKLTIRSIE